MVEVVAERGFAGTTVKLVTARAGVSSRTFYECFESLQDCFVALLDEGVRPVTKLICRAFEGKKTWTDGLRCALAALLSFLDSEPLLARVWLLESLAAGSWALECRERKMKEVLSAIVEPWSPADDGVIPPLAVEGSFASVLGIVVRHLLDRSPEPLTGLLGPLMGVAVAPYLDQRGVAREVELAKRLATEIRTCPAATDPGSRSGESDLALHGLLRKPTSGRALECLIFLAEHPDASNREVAIGIGVTHRSQISKLLTELAGKGLAVKRSEGPGKRNAWRLTSAGEEILQGLMKPRTPRSQDQ
jgi:AcrR family transcriptional regulator